MNLKEKDFIEIEFTGKLKEGEIFDSNIKEDAEKLHEGHDHPADVKPFVFCLGHGMFLKSLDDFLVGKKIGETYEVELEPEKAFGVRNHELVQMVPMRIFKEKQANPLPGMMLNFDGRVGKVLTVSGGRVMIDFNHALAGKTVKYKIKILRVVNDINEEVKAVNEFFFKKDFKFEIKEKKLIFEVEKELVKVVELFKDKFKEMLGLELEVKEIGERKNKVLEKENAK